VAAPLLTAAELRFLRSLLRHKVRFMVVGLSAAALQGAPVVTQDIDLWFEDLSDPNLAKALREIGAAYVPPFMLNPPMFAGEGADLFDIVLRMDGLARFSDEIANSIDVSLGRYQLKVLKLERAGQQARRRPPKGRIDDTRPGRRNSRQRSDPASQASQTQAALRQSAPMDLHCNLTVLVRKDYFQKTPGSQKPAARYIVYMRTKVLWIGLSGILVGCSTTSEWLDRIGGIGGTESAAALTQEQIVRGLKEALNLGVNHAVTSLGREDGFLANVQVRIPTPEKLRPVEQTLQRLGQGQLVDEFHVAINRAAEKAVPEAAEVLVGAIKQLTLTDAERILRGRDTEATDYFKRTSEADLHERFLPIVKDATARTGVTAAYKRMTGYPGVNIFSEALLGKEAADLDGYITQKALDGLFLKIGEEEKLIRENPAARVTEILRKVFGAIHPNTSNTSPRQSVANP
jgi:hypothetical protein